MSTDYQSGILAAANSDAIFATFNVTAQPQSLKQLRQVLAGIPALETDYRTRFAGADIHITVAIGAAFWDRYCPGQRPRALCAFPAMVDGDRQAPETPADLLLHIRAERHDLNYEIINRLVQQLGNSVSVLEEVHGFRYLDSRDLTGFVDGTENPEGEQRAIVALVGDEDAVFKGGSYLHLQRYEHDMTAWNAVSIKQQEDIIGRTKADNVEYASAEKPVFAHTRRTSLKDSDGQSLEILRHSMPYGNLQRRGLMFAAFGRSPEPFTRMLASMVKGDSEGHTDHLLKYTRAVTGQAFFAPSVAVLQAQGEVG